MAITFIYTTCADTCPLLTAKMASLQGRLGPDFGPRVQFLSITVDPERDTPEVLKRYAEGHGVQGVGWAFLTGTPSEIRAVTKRYGVYYRKTKSHVLRSGEAFSDYAPRDRSDHVHFEGGASRFR